MTVNWLNRTLLLFALCAPVVANAQSASLDESHVKPCLTCHGEQGIDLESGYAPRLHGKPAGYLYNQLINYREARRRHRAMQYMVSHLSDDYLWDMAQYFARRDIPYPAPAVEAPNQALREHGRRLVLEGDPARDIPACQACHGERLTGVQPNTPGLLGLPRAYIAAQFGAWQTGLRKAVAPDCMQQIAERLTGKDIQAASSWLAAQRVPADTTPATQAVAAPPMECGSVSLPGR